MELPGFCRSVWSQNKFMEIPSKIENFEKRMWCSCSKRLFILFFFCLFLWLSNYIAIIEVSLDSLYVIGGHDGTQSLQSVEILDHPNGQWRPGPILNIARANTHCVVTAGNIIYVLGGFDGAQFLSSIELLANGSNYF